MQTIAANDMGCAFISCIAAFSFPGLGHAHSPVKASCELWDERPQDFSGRNAAVLAQDSAQVLDGSRAGK